MRSVSKIESLELSLLKEKRTVAEIEQALQDAKAQKLVQQQLTKVRKHYGFLEVMSGQLSSTAAVPISASGTSSSGGTSYTPRMKMQMPKL